MIAVIADDITGAAEMAGIARCLGLRVMLTTKPDGEVDTDVLVIASDTRSMTEQEAARESAKLGTTVGRMQGVTHIFKKTDSALRGHVTAELCALLDTTGYDRAIYLPANPSKRRIIRDGTYYVDNRPLHETDFSFDPEFPAFSSILSERFPAVGERISFADATCTRDIEEVVEECPSNTMLAGAADLFTAFLDRRYPSLQPAQEATPHVDLSDSIIICGSTQSKPVECGALTAPMPLEVYDGTASTIGWITTLSEEYAAGRSLILTMAHHHRTGHESAVYLRETMASVVAALTDIRLPREIVIEGGATAYAILSRLGWKSFEITSQIAPGVIRMSAPNGTCITMKPGSYPWGTLFA